MRWLQQHLPLTAAAIGFLLWGYSTFAQIGWVKEYVDTRHQEVMNVLKRIDDSNKRQWDKIWELYKK